MDRNARQGLRRRNRQRAWLVAGVALGVAIVAALALLAWRQNQRTQVMQAFVAQTTAVLQATLQLEATSAAMEVQHRGFLLVGDRQLLAERDRAYADALVQADALRRLTANDPAQSVHVANARRAIVHRHAVMTDVSDRAVREGIDGIGAAFRVQGARGWDGIRDELDAVRANAEQRLGARIETARRNADDFARLLLLGTAAALMLVVAMTFLLSRQLRRNDRIRSALERDIVERRAAEEEVRALNLRLTENADALERTNRELEAFSYTISHDLRAPLRHIDGYARMLREDAEPVLDGDMRRYLDMISDGARRMGLLIDDLLAFSRLGRKPIELARVDMTSLARQSLAEAGGGRSPAHVDIGSLPEAEADPALLRQVWINLLSNALKYSAPRGRDACVAVTGERVDDRLRYTVSDNGVGFDMRYSDKLFGVFQRLHSHDEFEGTGVGLAIVQRILARHGGSVQADAAPGRGATFTFELPTGAET